MVITIELIAAIIIVFLIIIAAVIFMPRSRNYMNPDEMPTFLSQADIDDIKQWVDDEPLWSEDADDDSSDEIKQMPEKSLDLSTVESDFAEGILRRAKDIWGKSFVRITVEKIPPRTSVIKESASVTRCVIPLMFAGRKSLCMSVNRQQKFFTRDQPIICNARMKHSVTNDSDKDIPIVYVDITDEYSYI